MKHFGFGIGLLGVLLVLSLWLGSAVEEIHHTPAKDLDKAAQAAVEEDWPLATALYLRAERHWQKHRGLTAALSRHDPMVEIDAGFSTLKVYAALRDPSAFGAACAQLAQNLRSLPQSHSFQWWNLL